MCRVLLLEPDVTLGRALAAWLPVLGFEVVEPVVWEGPGSALDRARPGLVVIVVGGAAEMGLAIAEAVRRRSPVPIVLASGAWTTARLDRAARLGAVVLEKPFGLRGLADVLADAFPADPPALVPDGPF